MRKIVIQIKEYYDKGIYKIEQINAMLAAGKISADEYAYIIGLEVE